MTPEQQIEATRRTRRRQVRKEIILPIFGGFLLLIAIVVIAALLPSRGHTSFVADFLLTLLILCPAVICVFPIYMLIVFAVYGMGRVNRGIYRPLSAAEGLTNRLKTRTEHVADSVAQRTINLSSQVARLESVVLKIAEPDSRPDKEDQS